MTIRDKIDIQHFTDDISTEFFQSARSCDFLSCDIETTGLEWSVDNICLFQIYLPNETVGIVKVRDAVPELLCSLLADRRVKKLFHHAMFDLRFLFAHWRAQVENVACTKIAAKLLDPMSKQTSSLKPLLEQYLGVTINKHEQLSDWRKTELTNEQIEYAISDVVYLPDLLFALERLLRSKGLEEIKESCFQHIPTRVKLDVLGYKDVYLY